MDVIQIYGQLNNFSYTLLNATTSLAPVVDSIFENFWTKIVEWGFILLSTIIGAIVAIQVDRIFRDKERLNTNKLWKEAIKVSFATVFGLFVIGLLIAFAIFIGIAIIKWGMNYSSLFTLLAIIILILFWRYRKKKRNMQIAKPLIDHRKIVTETKQNKKV